MEQSRLRNSAFYGHSADNATTQRLARCFLNDLEAMFVAAFVFLERHEQLLSQGPVRLNAKSCRQKIFLV